MTTLKQLERRVENLEFFWHKDQKERHNLKKAFVNLKIFTDILADRLKNHADDVGAHKS